MKLKEKSTLKSLYTAILSIFLSIAMLLGTTYAWFTTSVTSGSNVIISGAFNVTIKYCDTYNGTYELLTNSSVLFNDVQLNPGESTPVKYIKIINKNGYAVSASIAIGTVDSSNGTNELQKSILFNVDSSKTVSELQERGNLEEGTVQNQIIISAQTEYVIAFAVTLPETAVTPGVTNSFPIIVSVTQANN